ncbi:mitochondrial ribosomal protein S25, partial [Gorgonomyces haynaldii]
KLRAKPFLMQEKIANQFAQGRIQQLPKWYDAMRLHPMAPPAQNTCIPEQVGHFQKPGTRSLLHQQQLENSKTSLYRYGKFNPASVYGRKPPVIEYDEDQIRSVFYRDHPYELDRPRLVQDQPQTLGKLVWSDIYAGEAQVPLSGESVVQRTLHLMQHKHTRHEAYRTALSEFYAAREAEEKRE